MIKQTYMVMLEEKLSSERKQLTQDKQLYNKAMKLEGQCKIQNLTLLKFNQLKAIILTILAVASIIGFFLMFYYKWVRVWLWFSLCEDEDENSATHLYIDGGVKNDDIQKLQRNQRGVFFYFKKLQYQLFEGSSKINHRFMPVAYNYEEKFSQLKSVDYLAQGLSNVDAEKIQKIYGKNQHPVQIPNYFSFMLETLLKPFFLLQYLVCISYFVQGYLIFTILNLIFSLITTSINYVLTYFSYKKIKEMAQVIHIVNVLRNGSWVKLQSTELMPGDLIVPEGEIICDCILIKDEVYVNQASLTGQNIPIGKSAAANIKNIEDHIHWLYQGSRVVEKRGHPLAIVINTGYSTRRGRIIRKILTKVTKSSEIFKKALIFLIEAFVVSLIIYFATLAFALSKNISHLIVGFRFVDFLGWAFPPTFPIYFNLAYSFAVVRLKHQNILCMEPDKTVEASNLQYLCFDKTGTLTQNNVQINKIYRFPNQKTIIDITKEKDKEENKLVMDLFATCHCTREINGQFMGDQVDLRMFLFSEYQMKQSEKIQVKFDVSNGNDKKKALEVLRINSFQSKFQCMSVLVRDISTNTYYVFIKGAPERLYRNSILKVNRYEETVTSISLGGYRTIAFAYKIIPKQQVERFLQCDRQQYEEKITLLGLVEFQNKLKVDTKETIERITKAGIESKMITGDNIFIAVQTGVRAGFLSNTDKVILLQGRNQPEHFSQQGNSRKFKGILLTRTEKQSTQEPIQLDQNTSYLHAEYPIAIDNDFLSMNPPPALSHKIKLFARISPQNKAKIITKYKEIIKQQFQKRSFFERTCGQLMRRVGMCGDGSNDLIAIRQSDVGIGLNDTDASYAATFTIKNLLDVDYIIRDSKANVTNIVEMIRYYEFITFLKIPSALLMLYDTTYFHQAQVLYMNFTCTIIYPIFQAMSRPSEIVTSAIPQGNFLGFVNHLRFWGSLIIATGGLVAGQFYFIQTDVYQPNPQPVANESWYTLTYITTCNFLMILQPFVIYAVFFYIGYPWKQPLYKNYILFILILLNVAATTVLYFITKYLIKLGVLDISNNVAGILFGIEAGACFLGGLYNLCITFCLNRGISERIQLQNKSSQS